MYVNDEIEGMDADNLRTCICKTHAIMKSLAPKKADKKLPLCFCNAIRGKLNYQILACSQILVDGYKLIYPVK